MNLSSQEKYIYITIGVLLLAALFVNLGLQPLFMEEPRRALIALEMILRDNYIVPTEFGDIYTKKPPLYNWVIIFFYKVLGSYSEWAVRLGSVLSLLSTAGAVYFMGKKFVDHRFGIISSFFYVIVADLLFVFSFLGEIDLFYSFLTVLSIFSIFYFYQKKQYYWLFFFTYFFGALGTLTKGLPSIPFLGISLFTFFLYKKEFKKLVSIHHTIGIITYLILVGGYAYSYHIQEDVVNFVSGMFGDASQRTTGGFPFWKYIKHIFLFPFQTLIALLPTSLFLLFFSKKALKSNPFVYFCFLLFASNIILYWISPGSKQRYLYPLYPFICIVLSYLLYSSDHKKALTLFHTFLSYLFILFGLVCLSFPFLTAFDTTGRVDSIPFLEIVTTTFGLLFILIGIFRLRVPLFKIPLFITGIILARLLVDITLIHTKNHSSRSNVIEREKAIELAKITKGTSVFRYDTSIKHRIAFYYSRVSNKILHDAPIGKANTTDFYILKSNSEFLETPHKTYLNFSSGRTSMVLIKFSE